MFLNVLVSNTRDDAFVAIVKTQNLKVFPYGGVHIRVPFGSYLFLSRSVPTLYAIPSNMTPDFSAPPVTG